MPQPIRNNFSSGELDPLMHSRYDLKQYANGAANLRNCVVLPQGGFRRRDGSRFNDELRKQINRIIIGVTITTPNGGAFNTNDDVLTTFATTTTDVLMTDPYVVVHYDLGAAATVLFADAVELRNTVNANAFTDFFIQYSTDNVFWVSLGAAFAPGTTEGVTRRRTGPVNARYWRVARIGNNDYGAARMELAEFSLWVEGVTLSDSRIVDFEFSTTQRYSILFTSFNARVFVNDAYQTDIRTDIPSASLANGQQFWWTQSLDTLIVGHPDIKPQRVQRQGSDTAWHSEPLPFEFIPKYAYALVETKPAGTLTPSAASGNITLTASVAPPFTAAHVNQFVDGNYGIARITEITSTTVVKAITVSPFFDTSAIATGGWTLRTGYEDVWSAARGWPGAGIFMQNRLALGGGRSLPNGLGLSRVAEYFNFDPGQALDDEAIFHIISADDVPAIYGLMADRHLQIFTSSAEYYVPLSEDTPLTPRNFTTRRTTAYGMKSGVRPVNISGATIFAEQEGKVGDGSKAFREFVYTQQTESAYVAGDLSLQAAHLVKGPVDVALVKSFDRGALLVAVNGDGTIAASLQLRGQEINAWTPWDTDGLYLRVGATGTNLYAVVERTINGVARRFFERFDSALYVDCAVEYGASGPVFTGLSHLEGKTVEIRADKSKLTNEIVASGQVTADRASVTDAQIGLDYTNRVLAKTLPAVYETSEGVIADGKGRISRIMLDLFETQSIIVQGESVPFRQIGAPMDTPPPIFTGRKIVDGLLGWDDLKQITITQDAPAPMTVRGLQFRLRV